ncbi:MAG: META domain-containing protein [Chloroflexi bacterium]|nr:META domain-containing protein [Chloroflexota bacterium]
MRNLTIKPKIMSTKFNKILVAAILITLLFGALSACTISNSEDLKTEELNTEELIDTSWQLDTMNGNSPVPDSTLTIEFTEDKVSGNMGCNNYESSYQTDGDNLDISEVTIEVMPCVGLSSEEIIGQEGAFKRAIESTDSYEISGDQLIIYDASGAQILVFSRQ